MPEKRSPAIIAPPKPRHKGSDKVIGISPTTVVIVPNIMGSTRDAAPSAIAWVKPIPALWFLPILSIISIEW